MSGGGAASPAAERAAAVFLARGHVPELSAWTLAGPGASDLARAAAEAGADRVVAIGGDGTALDVAAGLLAAGREAALGVIPRGTANLLALNLGIPTALDRAIMNAADGVVTRVDVGMMRRGDSEGQGAGGDPFLLSVGTGLHAEMVVRADRAAKRRWGVMAYVLAGWRSVPGAKAVRYRLTLDGETEEMEATMIQVMNCGAVLRRAWSLAPGISPVDGRLDVLVYRARSFGEYARVMARVIQGEPTATPLVLHRRAERVRIEAEEDVPVQRDGETAGPLPVDFEVLPRALSVVVPPGSAWAEADGPRADAVTPTSGAGASREGR